MTTDVHPTAVVSNGAEIGEGVYIGPYCLVGPTVRIGDGCHLMSHVVVDGDTHIGARCEVFQHCVIGTKPQDKKLSGKALWGKLRIGDDNTFREFVTIHGGSPPDGTTWIGDDNMLLSSAHVGHDTRLGSHCVLTNLCMTAGHTEVGDRAVLGAATGLHQYARVGRLAMVGAGSMASKDVPPFSMVQGDRARLRGINAIGLARTGMTPEQVTRIKRAFRLLFWRSGTLDQRITEVRPMADEDPNVAELIRFIETSKRGVIMPKSEGPDEVEQY